MKAYKIFLRIITYPAIVLLLLMACVKLFVGNSIQWFRYGGELVISTDKTPETIAELFNLIEK